MNVKYLCVNKIIGRYWILLYAYSSIKEEGCNECVWMVPGTEDK